MNYRTKFQFSLVALLLLFALNTGAQTSNELTLETCQQLARQHYPLLGQAENIQAISNRQSQSIRKGYLPQLSIYGQASYQSDVTEVPVTSPLQTIEPLDKDQYKIYGDVSQLVYDGGVLKQQERHQKNVSNIETGKLEVELYQLKQRINQLFFGILLTEAQLNQIQIKKKDLIAGLNKTEAAVKNGVALKSNFEVLRAEILKAHQFELEIISNLSAYRQMLSKFINQPVDSTTRLIAPSDEPSQFKMNRPELNLFAAQDQTLDAQLKLLNSKNRPKLGLFFQGGYGKPGLNMLLNEFDTFYIGGIRLQWNIAGFYTSGKEKQVINLNKKQTKIAKDNFLFNTDIAMAQQNEELVKLNALLKTDDEIIDLRDNIRKSAEAQLENGVITSNDYLREVNALDLARQSKITHEIQYMMAIANQKYLTGN